MGADGRALIATAGTGTGNPPQNTLPIFDRTQSVFAGAFRCSGGASAHRPSRAVPSTTLVRPDTTFFSKLIRTPDGQFIVGPRPIPARTPTFLCMKSPPASSCATAPWPGSPRCFPWRRTARASWPASRMYDMATLAVIGAAEYCQRAVRLQRRFQYAQNVGGSAFAPDGDTLYSAFNTAQFNLPRLRPPAPPC